jgi:type I restriction enzyme M protein
MKAQNPSGGERASMNHFSDKVNLIWDIADTLRGPYRPPEYRKVMLPMTVLRRLDCVLEPTKHQVLETQKKWNNKAADALLRKAARQSFYNTSKLDFERLKGDSNNIAPNLLKYIRSFSPNVRAIFEYFGFDDHVAKLENANRLFLIVSKFAAVDLHPEAVPNHQMGLVFEELVRKFNEAANEEAGDHFTPREVIKLMVNILFDPDDDILTQKGIIRTLYDPTCGTGGMLTVSSEHLHRLNPDAQLILFGQDYNPEAYAICCADMLIKGQSLDNIKFGDTIGDGKTEDYLPDHKFHYMLANPPFGVKWEPEKDTVVNEHDDQGYDGRFGAGYPRINDGSFSVPAAHDLQDAALRPQGSAGLAHRHRVQWVAALHRRCGFRRERNPPLDHRERLAGGHRGAPRSALLQHRNQHVHLDRHQSQGPRAQGEDPTDQRGGFLPQDAQESR